MTTAGKKILAHYEEGRITATGAILRLLALTNREEMEEMIEASPPDLLEELKEFLRDYRPDMRIFPPQPPPSPAAVEMARAVLAEPVRSGL